MADQFLQIGNITYRVEPTKLAKKYCCDRECQQTYLLHGPRGSCYLLIRNKPNPHLMFAVNDKDWTRGTPFENQWFSDKDGTLKFL